jgi:hypothetical protein
MNKRIKALLRKVEAVDNGLPLEAFNNQVFVEHQDGSKLLYKHACVSRAFGDGWYVVFTEHNSSHLFAVGDTRLLAQAPMWPKRSPKNPFWTNRKNVLLRENQRTGKVKWGNIT